MTGPVIIDAVRTPFTGLHGAFSELHPQDLAAKPLTALEHRNGFSGPDDIEDVKYGCVSPIGEQGSNVGRLAPMIAGWGDDVPGVQLERACGSGQEAINLAAAKIHFGAYNVAIGGGVEHMTRVIMRDSDDLEVDRDTISETYFEYFDELTSQGEGAERIAAEAGFTREEVDGIAVDSQKRWAEAADAGKYADHVVPVEAPQDGKAVTIETDQHPRPGTDLETLGELPLAFRGNEGVIHAGNSSGIVDGAAAALVASEAAAREHDWEPMARIIDTNVVGVDPVTMLTGPVPATEGLLAANDLTVGNIDYFEVNEAFAPVISYWLEETGAPWERTNVWGGAIAHGHPLGATGAALMGKLAHILQEEGGTYGICTMCIGFGQGIATLIERV
jgi:acetyl-CoA C-acetyltransferase/acetyl-CoA acyltransferase